jgi:hypothetical protein
MPQLTKNNPAGFLHAILTSLCQMPETNPALTCFGAVFQTKDLVQIMERAAEMANLAGRAEERIRSLTGIDHNLYLSWKPEVMAAFGALAFQGTLSAFVRPLKENNSRALERLHFCAAMLAERCGEKQLEYTELLEFQREIDSLRTELRAAQIDDELKLFLQYQLGMIRDAIDQYLIFGIGPLESAAHQTIGSLFFNSEVRNRTKDTPVIRKYADLLVKIGQQIAVGVSAGVLTDMVERLLLPPR